VDWIVIFSYHDVFGTLTQFHPNEVAAKMFAAKIKKEGGEVFKIRRSKWSDFVGGAYFEGEKEIIPKKRRKKLGIE